MAIPPDHFARIAAIVNLELLATRLVVVAGVGTVGSQIAQELANSGVGRLRLIDGDPLDTTNLVRHVLPRRYVGMNKAEALTLHLSEGTPGLRPEGLARYVDQSLSDPQVDRLLADAHVIVAATDDRVAQRRVARRALSLDIPCILPALYGDGEGEVFVQRSPRNACYLCWDAFRPVDERMRAVSALNIDTFGVVRLGVELCLGVLDPASSFRRLLAAPPHDPRPRQLFVERRLAARSMAPMPRRPNCPACAVGPASSAPRENRYDTRPRSTNISSGASAQDLQGILLAAVTEFATRQGASYKQRRDGVFQINREINGLVVPVAKYWIAWIGPDARPHIEPKSRATLDQAHRARELIDRALHAPEVRLERDVLDFAQRNGARAERKSAASWLLTKNVMIGVVDQWSARLDADGAVRIERIRST